jgi:protoheme IX farnesyltransferase
MPVSESRSLQRLTLAALAIAALLVVAGNVVRISGEGPSCPDWPLCFGTVLPMDNSKAVAEVIHRALAAAAGLALLIVAAVCVQRRRRLNRSLVWYSFASLALLLAQVALGALSALRPWPAWGPAISALHLIVGLGMLGCVAAMYVEARYPSAGRDARPAGRSAQRFRRSIRALVGATFILLATGAFVSGSGAAMACGQTFPSCNGGLVPNGGVLVFLQWLHRAAVFAVACLLFSLLARWVRQDVRVGLDPRIQRVGWAFVAAFFVVGALGWLMVSLNRPAVLATLHNATAAVLWVCAVVLSMLVDRLPVAIPEPTSRPVPAWQQTIRDYVALTKPRVISLLLFTTLAAMFITPAGTPSWYLVVWTLIGGYLMAGGANAVNMAFDSDIDHVMGRTSRRPVPSGRIAPRWAFAFGLVLAGLSLLIFLLFVNWLAAVLAVVGFLYYTVIYTRCLKRSTWQNIVIGGGAGAIPPMIGWAAASGRLSLTALVLFAIVFYWTPPHFWALALLKRKDYAAAGVPMLPVVAGDGETARQILIYSFGMFALTLMLVPVQAMGGVYLVGAIALGAWFLWLAWRVNHEHTPQAALKLYVYSLLYLFALFAVMMVDRIVL